MENTIGKSSREERENEKDYISVRRVLEMCYAKATVDSAVEQLRKQGTSKYTSTDIMESILDRN